MIAPFFPQIFFNIVVPSVPDTQFLNLTPELTGKLLSKGDWVEAIEPKELREKIKEQAQAIAELYRKKRFWE